MATIKQWANTFYVLGRVLSQAIITEWNNPSSPFKESTHIPEWLNALNPNKNEINNLAGGSGLVEQASYNSEDLDLWRSMIFHSNFKGYVTVFEFRRLHQIDRQYHLSIYRTAKIRAKKYGINFYPKTNEWGVTTDAFPIEFLEKICIEKGYL